LVAALVALAGCADREDAPEPASARLSIPFDSTLLGRLPAGASENVLREGERLYRNCSVCHGLDGEGTQLGPPLADSRWMHIGGEVEEIAGIIRAGVPSPREYPVPMPPMGGDDLTDEDVYALSLYVRARSLVGE
jgi:mono/diheme cytochrome c family protein